MLSASELFGPMTKICIVQALEPKMAYWLEKKTTKIAFFSNVLAYSYIRYNDHIASIYIFLACPKSKNDF